MVTVAFGTIAPELSVMTPTASAVVIDWLNVNGAKTTNNAAKMQTERKIRLVNAGLP